MALSLFQVLPVPTEPARRVHPTRYDRTGTSVSRVNGKQLDMAIGLSKRYE
jgi:hypothetical protein